MVRTGFVLLIVGGTVAAAGFLTRLDPYEGEILGLGGLLAISGVVLAVAGRVKKMSQRP